MTTVTAFLRAGAVSETSSQSSRLSQGAAPDVSHPHRNPAKRLRWGEEGQGSGVRDGHKAVPNGADFELVTKARTNEKVVRESSGEQLLKGYRGEIAQRLMNTASVVEQQVFRNRI